MILGLDISTTTIGFCLLKDGVIIEAGAIKLDNIEGPFKKAETAKAILSNLPSPITTVAIEKSLMGFSAGASSAKTLHTLASFNGIISWIVYDLFGIEPIYLSATSARSTLGIKIPKGQKAKDLVMTWVMQNETSFQPDTTKSGKAKKHFYDIADAIVIARASELI